MRRNEARAEGGVLRRVAAAGVAVLTAATMAVSSPLTALAAEAQGGNSPAVTVNKVATPLDENDQTDVTLSIGSTEETTVSDVVFVLDKSASTDIRQEAMNMLDELMKQADKGNLVKVGVVNFEKGVLESLPLTELNAANYEKIRESVIFWDVDSSGTNIPAGLEAGEQMLDADTSVAASNKHLVLVTDGVGYLWNGPDGTAYSIYSESTSNGEENLYASHETIDWHHGSKDYYDEFLDMATWYGTYGASIASDIAKYQVAYDSGQYQAKYNGVTHGQGTDTDWSVIPKFAVENSYVPAELESQTASAPDAAIYTVATDWQRIAGKYNAYSYADPRYMNKGEYAWAYNAIANLGDLGGYSAAIPATVAEYSGMFDSVKSSVLYEIASGTVTDVIGDDFNLTGLDTLKMTVGDKTLEGTVSGNTVTFDNGNYVVSYDEAAKTLTWKINVPVEAANGITLSYNLTLANKEAVAGDYTVPTNESAKLDYTRHDGSTGTATFPVPGVSYSIAAETTGGFTAQKELEGAELTDGEFSFQVKDADGNVIDEATNDADGKIAFGKNMTYSAPGTYEYTISEVLPEDDDPDTAGVQKDDVTYDETVQKVTVDVKLVGNELVATWNLPKDGVKFTNVYTAEETPVEEPAAEEPAAEQPKAEEPKKDEAVPNTGDPTSLMAVGAALVAGVGAAAAGIAVRRRNK